MALFSIYCCYLLVPSTSVRNLSAIALQNGTTIVVDWVAPKLSNINGELLYYTITYFDLDTYSGETTIINITALNIEDAKYSINLTHLQEFTRYLINVSLYTDVGKGPDNLITQRTIATGKDQIF